MRLSARSGSPTRRSRFTCKRASRPRVEALEGRSLMSGVTDIDLDLGTTSSPVASGWVGVPVATYTPARGYGWHSTSRIKAVDRGGPDPLNRDFHVGLIGIFNVDVPSGLYTVAATVGDGDSTRKNMFLYAENETLASNVSTKPGEFIRSISTVEVTDGQLNILALSFNKSGFALGDIQIHRDTTTPTPTPTPIPTPTPTPTASAGPSQVSSEGSEVSFNGSASGFVTPSYQWDFGDGTGANGTLLPNHAYQDNGIYTATLTVADGGNSVRSSTTVSVTNAAPAAAITGMPAGSSEGKPITLGSVVTDPSPGDVAAGLGRSWSVTKNGVAFASGAGPNFTFMPDDDGTYAVTLTATDKDGGTSAPTSQTVNVSNVAPTASAGGPYGAAVGQTVRFTGSAFDPSVIDTGAGLNFAWNFGDGSPIVSGLGLVNPSHLYAAAGSYNAVVTVTDKDGLAGVPASSPVSVSVVTTADNLGHVRLTPGWATFGEALPQGQAWGGLKIGDLATQTDVKTTWSDGSIRFAIVSASVPAAGTYPITAASPSMGSVSPTIPNASVQLTIGGVRYTAALPPSKSNDPWLNGPLVSEWRTTAAPVDPSGRPHPFLRVIFDTRSYVDGPERVDVTVENVLDRPDATSVSYSVDILAGGQTLYHHDTLTHYWMTRWRQVIDLGLAAAEVTPDLGPAYQAGALPIYMDSVPDYVDSPTGPTFDLLGRGGLSYDSMWVSGGRPEIAPYPDWTARYLVHLDPAQRQFVLANGDLSGSQPIHIRSADGDRISIDSIPDFWLDPRAHPWQPGPVGDWDARGPLVPDSAHQPSLAYVPYLLTGDRYYADEMTAWGDFDLLASFTSNVYEGQRGESQGLLRGNQIRGFAWALRNLADAAAYLPDADPAKPYFTAKVANNMEWLEEWATTQSTPLGPAWIAGRSDAGDPEGTRAWIAPWEHYYLAWAIDHSNNQGFSGGELLRDQIAQFQINLFNSPDIPREYAGSYVWAIGDWTPGGVEYYTNLGQVFQNTFAPGQPPISFANYGTQAHAMIMIGLENSLSTLR